MPATSTQALPHAYPSPNHVRSSNAAGDRSDDVQSVDVELGPKHGSPPWRSPWTKHLQNRESLDFQRFSSRFSRQRFRHQRRQVRTALCMSRSAPLIFPAAKSPSRRRSIISKSGNTDRSWRSRRSRDSQADELRLSRRGQTQMAHRIAARVYQTRREMQGALGRKTRERIFPIEVPVAH